MQPVTGIIRAATGTLKRRLLRVERCRERALVRATVSPGTVFADLTRGTFPLSRCVGPRRTRSGRQALGRGCRFTTTNLGSRYTAWRRQRNDVVLRDVDAESSRGSAGAARRGLARRPLKDDAFRRAARAPAAACSLPGYRCVRRERTRDCPNVCSPLHRRVRVGCGRGRVSLSHPSIGGAATADPASLGRRPAIVREETARRMPHVPDPAHGARRARGPAR